MARETVSRNKVKSTSAMPMIVAFTVSQCVGFFIFFNIFGVDFMGIKVNALISDSMFMFILGFGLFVDFLLDFLMISKLKSIRIIKIKGPMLVQNLKRNHRRVHYVLCGTFFISLLIIYTPIKNILPLQLFVFVTNASFQLMVPMYLAIALSKSVFYADIKRFAINKDYKLDNVEETLSLGKHIFNVVNYFMPLYRYAIFLRDVTLYRYVVNKIKLTKKMEENIRNKNNKNLNRRPVRGEN